MRGIKNDWHLFWWPGRALSPCKVWGKIVQRAPAVGAKMWCLLFFYRQDCREVHGKLPVLNLFTGQKWGFSPRRGDSLHRFRSNLAGPTGTWVRLAAQNFTSVGAGGWDCGPKYQKFPLYGKELPRRGEPFDRFLTSLRAFILTTTLHRRSNLTWFASQVTELLLRHKGGDLVWRLGG